MTEKNVPKPGKHDRPCPAMDGFIKSADCGAQRGSKLACPATCRYYPFGTSRESYDAFLKLDQQWGTKMFDRLIALRGQEYLQHFMREARKLGEEENSRLLAMSHGLFYGMFFARDAAGKRLVDRWEAEGFQGLNNDERVMTIYSSKSRVTVVEVQKVLSDQHVLCVDLLSPTQAAFLVQDRSVGRQANRFSRFLCWLSPLHHHTRLSAANVNIVFEHYPLWREVMEQRLTKLRQKEPTAAMSDLLAHEFFAAALAVVEVGYGLHEQMLRNTDLHHCRAVYGLRVPLDQVEGKLAGRPDFDPVSPSADAVFGTPLAQYDWLALGKSAEAVKGLPHVNPKNVSVLGRLRLYADHLVLEAFSRKKYDWTRAHLEAMFGSTILWERESVEDEALKQLGHRPYRVLAPDVQAVLERHGQTHSGGFAFDFSRTRSALPPEQLTKAEMERNLLKDSLDQFVDSPVPALGDRTPRQASKVTALRAELVELVKGHLHHADSICREHGIQIDSDWILDELGLSELK